MDDDQFEEVIERLRLIGVHSATAAQAAYPVLVKAGRRKERSPARPVTNRGKVQTRRYYANEVVLGASGR